MQFRLEDVVPDNDSILEPSVSDGSRCNSALEGTLPPDPADGMEVEESGDSLSPSPAPETSISLKISIQSQWNDINSIWSSATWDGVPTEGSSSRNSDMYLGSPDSDPGSINYDLSVHEERRNFERFESFPKTKSRRRVKSGSSSQRHKTDNSNSSGHAKAQPAAAIPIPKSTQKLDFGALFSTSEAEEPLVSKSAEPIPGDMPVPSSFSPRNYEKVRQFEESFKGKYGFPPSYRQKMSDEATKKYLTAIEEAKTELKVFENKKMTAMFADKQSFRRRRGSGPNLEDTVRKIKEHLDERRASLNIPSSCDLMTREQLVDEKERLQTALLHLETTHGRPLLRNDKEMVKPLYDRYRLLKRLIIRSGVNQNNENADLVPILEHQLLEFDNDNTWPKSSSSSQRSSFHQSDESLSEKDETADIKRQKFDFGESFHALPLHELISRLSEARQEKRRLRRLMGEAESFILDRFAVSPVSQDEIYHQYKHAKAKIRLLDALVAKHQRSLSF
ncbi:protein FAM13B-like isoform X2 [Artemia franciscana]|uniref:Protein FAM13A n=1 Tax=Artemia franciscana TaxID=6661 RepID=A0AA88IL52_ARTSF|nr:hypothetical protein QYM36_000319 [Artemia franciscana]KAK2725791.1 hypothetical protein QYM36_000319 [Artemia franciscana]